MSKRYAAPPSRLLSVDDPYHAWCLDEAVYIFGSWVEGELAEAASKHKKEPEKASARQRRLHAILTAGEAEPTPTDPEAPPAPKGAFRDPAELIGSRRRG